MMDCCYTGETDRNPDDTVRGVKPVENARLPGDIDREVRTYGLPLDETGTAQLVVPAEFHYQSLTSHVLLNACRKHGETDELPHVKGLCHGCFTIALIDVLNEDTVGMTYESLFDQLPYLPRQRPKCYGDNRNRLLWSTITRDAEGYRITRNDDGTFVVHAGNVHGITDGTTFVVRANNQSDDTSHLRIRSKSTDIYQCLCEAVNAASLRITYSTRAVLDEMQFPDGMKLRIAPSPETKYRLPNPLPSILQIAPSRAEANLEIIPHSSSPDRFCLQRLTPFIENEEVPVLRKIHLENSRISHIFERIMRFSYHLHRPSPSETSERLSVSVELYRLRETFSGVKTIMVPDDQQNLFQANRRFCQPEAENNHGILFIQDAVISDLRWLYGLKLVNKSDQDLFPYVFYFDPSEYSIEV